MQCEFYSTALDSVCHVKLQYDQDRGIVYITVKYDYSPFYLKTSVLSEGLTLNNLKFAINKMEKELFYKIVQNTYKPSLKNIDDKITTFISKTKNN